MGIFNLTILVRGSSSNRRGCGDGNHHADVNLRYKKTLAPCGTFDCRFIFKYVSICTHLCTWATTTYEAFESTDVTKHSRFCDRYAMNVTNSVNLFSLRRRTLRKGPLGPQRVNVETNLLLRVRAEISLLINSRGKRNYVLVHC